MQQEWLNSCGSTRDAETLAEYLRSYWRDKGHKIAVWTETVSARDNRTPVYCLRSDLVNGLPPKETVQ
jgi:hypothetical protein